MGCVSVGTNDAVHGRSLACCLSTCSCAMRPPYGSNAIVVELVTLLVLELDVSLESVIEYPTVAVTLPSKVLDFESVTDWLTSVDMSIWRVTDVSSQFTISCVSTGTSTALG